MLTPRNPRYRKVQKGSLPNTILSGNRKPQFGCYALKATSFGILSSRQIEAGRKLIMKKVKKRGKLWVRIFPHTPVTRKPVEVRMGKGKGAVDHWVFKVRPGAILYEVEGLSSNLVSDIFKLVSKKLSVSTKMSQE
jgi:large subunit ribosomal protein L16